MATSISSAQTKTMVQDLQQLIQKYHSHRPFLVCGHSFMTTYSYQELLMMKDVIITTFHDYEPNPKYESVVKGLAAFYRSNSDLLISIGGGSPMDVAKSIKAFYNMKPDIPFVNQPIFANPIVHIAIPTTAGTGSEVTHFAVIYYQGKKYSISDESLLPEAYVLAPSLLDSLPLYQRQASMLDALCHAIESIWALKATCQSQTDAQRALMEWIDNYRSYLAGDVKANGPMLEAANLAGRAINISTTTAAHAMAYKLTSLYGIAHGHAVALCLPKIWRYMMVHLDQVQKGIDAQTVSRRFEMITQALGQKDVTAAIEWFEALTTSLELTVPTIQSKEQLEDLTNSVNLQRLRNNPIKLDRLAIKEIYLDILQ